MKKFLMFMAFCFVCFFIYKGNVHADTLFFNGAIWPQYNGGNGYKDYNNFYNSLDSGGAYTYKFALNGSNNYDLTQLPNFVVMKFCATTPVSSYWYSDKFSTMTVEMTDNTCHYFGSDKKGKTGFAIMALNKPSIVNSNCNTGGSNCNFYNMAFNLSFDSANYLRLMSLSAYASVPEIQNANSELNTNLYNFNLDFQKESNETQKKLDEANQNIYNFNLDYQKESKKTREKIDETNQNIKETNDTLKDSDTSEANSSANSFFNDFDNDDFGLSDIISMPLKFIESLSSNTCNNLSLPVPFVNQNIELPCMTSIYEKHFAPFLIIYQLITTGFISYWVCINIFRLVQGFKNPDKNEIEVLDL